MWYIARKYQSLRIGLGVTSGLAGLPWAAGIRTAMPASIMKRMNLVQRLMFIRLKPRW